MVKTTPAEPKGLWATDTDLIGNVTSGIGRGAVLHRYFNPNPPTLTLTLALTPSRRVRAARCRRCGGAPIYWRPRRRWGGGRCLTRTFTLTPTLPPTLTPTLILTPTPTPNQVGARRGGAGARGGCTYYDGEARGTVHRGGGP